MRALGRVDVKETSSPFSWDLMDNVEVLINGNNISIVLRFKLEMFFGVYSSLIIDGDPKEVGFEGS